MVNSLEKGKKDNFRMENAFFREINIQEQKKTEMEGRNHYRNEEQQVTLCSVATGWS